MNTENLSTLKIHKLTQAQYDRELEAGRVDPSAIYLTPDDGDNSNIYIQNEEPVDAEDGSLWVDMDAQGSNGGNGNSGSCNTNSGFIAQPEAPSDTSLLWLDTDDDSSDSSTVGGADWNAAEGEPGHILNRPFYSVAGTTVEILPETRPIYVEAEDMFITGNIPALTAGAEYTVNWNGTAYTCTASAIPIAEGIEAIFLGDVGMLDSGTPETGEPFGIVVVPAEMDGGVAIVPFDGTTELVLSILGIGETVVPIPQKYLGDLRAQKKYIIDRDQGITPSLEALWKMDTAELQAALVWIEGGTEKNVTIVSRADVEEDGIRYHQIYLSVPVDGARINYYRWTSGGIILVRESWIPAALPKGISGTFMLIKRTNEEQASFQRVNEVALPGIVLYSTTQGSSKKFLITVDDNGNLTATQQ